MIIDFHTHVFPPKIVEKAIEKLKSESNNISHLNGLEEDLLSSMDRTGIDRSVLLAVATSPAQTKSINEGIIRAMNECPRDRMIRFGAIHPDNEDWKDILHELSSEHVRGIKIHPVFQGTAIDDLRFERIIGRVSELGMITVTHAGYDVGFPGPGADQVLPDRVLKLLEDVGPEKFVLAHMGGWNCWDQVLEKICGRNVYLDTSFSLTDIVSPTDGRHTPQLSREKFLQLVRAHGADKILFGTDSPWSSQGETLDILRSLPLVKSEKDRILGDNAAKLLCL